ncbi:MAG: peptidoglycan-binding protein [Boseongicola sp.]|nr:peptidoglycan-binding protein [Boseongicola sp.]
MNWTYHLCLELRWMFDNETLRSRANLKDRTGISPLQAAVLTGRSTLVKRFVDARASVRDYTPSLQDIARSRNDWKVLAALPYDRTPPRGFAKGASLETKKEMQRRLKQWGYYSGTIDGLLGRGSQAALRAYYQDVEKELKLMLKPSTDLSKNSVDIGSTYYFASTQPEGSWCWWKVNYWRQNGSTQGDGDRSEKFVGCVGAESKWNANGAALVVFESGPTLKFFGPNGWDDDIDIR